METHAVIMPAVIALFGVLYVLRFIALRRLGPAHPAYPWLVFGRMFVVPAALIWIALTTASSNPAISLLLGLLGLAFGALVIRTVRRVGHALVTSEGKADPLGAMMEPIADFALVGISATLIGSLLLGVGLIVWVIVTGGR